MRAGRFLMVVAAAAICFSAVAAVAVAGGKKKSTSVVFFSGSPKVNNGGKVTAKGAVNSVSACESGRSVRLQLQDSTGAVLSTLGGTSSLGGGNFSASGQLPTLADGTYAVRVKVKKASAGKFVCKAGVSASVPFTVPVK